MFITSRQRHESNTIKKILNPNEVCSIKNGFVNYFLFKGRPNLRGLLNTNVIHAEEQPCYYIIQGFGTIIFIFIVKFPMFRPMSLSAFFTPDNKNHQSSF